MTARKSVTSSAALSLDALLENRPGSVRTSTEAPLADLSIHPSLASSRALRLSVTRGSGTGGGFVLEFSPLRCSITIGVNETLIDLLDDRAKTELVFNMFCNLLYLDVNETGLFLFNELLLIFK